MPRVYANGINQHYELAGNGLPLVFVHGAFVDRQMWQPQWEYFSRHYRVLRYDLRGHGQTEPGSAPHYSIALLADDLRALLDALAIPRAVVCGLSLGGMIAQQFAVCYPERVQALVLADTAVSVSLTLTDKLQRYVLFPKWAMQLSLQLLPVEQFVDFSFWLAATTRSEQWLGRDAATRAYIRACMRRIARAEYRKVYAAIYDFRLLDLARITAPTLVLNGAHESPAVFRHSAEIVRRVADVRAFVVPHAGHTSNMENPRAFNGLLAAFLVHAA